MPSLKSAAKIVKEKTGLGKASGKLLKLQIISCDDPDGKQKGSGLTFYSQLNPNKYSENVSVEVTETKIEGTKDPIKKFRHVNSTDLELELILDGTGVVEMTTKDGTSKIKDDNFVTEQIKLFKDVALLYDGEKHEIPYVNVIWGRLNFKGRLKSLDISHSLFNSQGKPLRSTLKAIFSSSSNIETLVKQQALKSPDLTHLLTVRTGDTLPLMCQTIYNDSSYYLKVAKFNGLVDFRNLEPGTEIIFPPIL
jgi:hypothetical protein